MKKRPLQDIVVKPSRTRREGLHASSEPARPTRVPLGQRSRGKDREQPEGSHHNRREHGPRKVERARGPMPDDDLFEPGERSGFPWLIVSGIVGALVIIGMIVFSIMFSGARVTVFPQRATDVFIDGRFFARAQELPGELTYTTMTVERTASRTVEADQEEQVEERARGTIIVSNDFSEESYRLIERTRFEAPDGRIYRIEELLEVPGQSVNAAGELVPGEVEVEVVADEAGEEYNISSAEFTIPGFAGMPQFEEFSARTKTPITGGFVGQRLTVEEERREEIRRELQDELRAELKEAALSSSERPEGHYLFEDGIEYAFESLPQENAGDGSVELRERGTATAILLDEGAFAEHLAANTVAGYDGNPVELDDVEELSVSVSPLDDGATSSEEALYALTISGTADFTWVFDPEELRRDLAGKEEAATDTVLSGHPGIDHVQVSLWPLWRGSYPDNIDDIQIVVSEEGA